MGDQSGLHWLSLFKQEKKSMSGGGTLGRCETDLNLFRDSCAFPNVKHQGKALDFLPVFIIFPVQPTPHSHSQA